MTISSAALEMAFTALCKNDERTGPGQNLGKVSAQPA
jgi:hypothetical protein